MKLRKIKGQSSVVLTPEEFQVYVNHLQLLDTIARELEQRSRDNTLTEEWKPYWEQVKTLYREEQKQVNASETESEPHDPPYCCVINRNRANMRCRDIGDFFFQGIADAVCAVIAIGVSSNSFQTIQLPPGTTCRGLGIGCP